MQLIDHRPWFSYRGLLPHQFMPMPGLHKVIRNTYTLLSLTLSFSAIAAGTSLALRLPHPGLLLTLGGYFGLLSAVSKFHYSGLGLAHRQ